MKIPTEVGPTTDQRRISLKAQSQKADAPKIGRVADDGNEAGEVDAALRFSLALTIRHPDMDPRAITLALGRDPYQAWRAGEPRRTPTGHPMPSVGRESYCVWRKELVGQRDFFAAVLAELDWLRQHTGLLEVIAAGGGEIALSLALPGDVNIGATLPHDALRRLASLPIDLGIEVFPAMA